MAADHLLGRTFVELADTLVEDYDLIEFLNLLAARAVDLLDVTAAGVLLADERGRLRLLASSSERMRLLELIELQSDEGPCLECWRSGEPVREDDLAGHLQRWPTFGTSAHESGFASVYALPLRLRSQRLGALNLFANRVDGLSDGDQALGQALADVATIGIIQQRTVEEHATVNGQLQTALDSRVALEQAKGMVAEQAGIDAEEAFELLRSHARHHNRQLGDVVSAVRRRAVGAADLAIVPGSPGTAPGS